MINQGGQINVRIGRASYRIPHGKTIPDVVEKFWKKNKQIDDLLKNGHLSEKQLPSENKTGNTIEAKKTEVKSNKIDSTLDKEIKEEKKVESI